MSLLLAGLGLHAALAASPDAPRPAPAPPLDEAASPWPDAGGPAAGGAPAASGAPPVSGAAVSLSLDEALALATKGSEARLIAAAGTAAAEADRAAARGGRLPQLGGSVAYNHTFASEYDNLFDTGSTGGTNPFADLPFGAADTWRVDLSASQVVYGGGRVRAQNQLAEASLRLAELGEHSTEATSTQDVVRAYFDVALMERLEAIAAAGVAQAETTKRHAEAAFREGRQPEFELVRAGVELENQRVALLAQGRWRALANTRLALLLGLDPSTRFTLTTPLDATLPGGLGEGDPEGPRVLVQQAEEGVAVAEAAVKLARSAGLPQLGVSGSVGFVAYPDNPLPPTSDWRTNVSAGAAVSMPLFAGGVIRGQIRSAQADLQAARARADQARELAALDRLDALTALSTARATWEATSGTVEQAQRAYQIAEVRFQEGLSTQSELSDARLLLQRAEVSRAQAARDVSLALFRVSHLPSLPPQIGG